MTVFVEREVGQPALPLIEDEKLAIWRMLLGYRLHNYGYGARDWQRIKQQAVRARQELYRMGLSADLNWNAAFMRRIRIMSKGQVHYTVGQSENEEIINAMRQLAGKDKWVS